MLIPSMPEFRRYRTFGLLLLLLLVPGHVLYSDPELGGSIAFEEFPPPGAGFEYPMPEDGPDLSAWQDADIDWRQFAGSELSVLADAQPAFQSLAKHIPYFEALTGIKVGYHQLPQARMRAVRKIDLATGAGIYDVVPMGVAYLGQAHNNAWLEPLETYLQDTELTDLAWYDFGDLSPRSIALCTKDEQLLALPFDFSAPILFYRKDLFSRYGVEVPDTYEDLIRLKVQLQLAMEADGMDNIYAFAARTRVGAGMNTRTVIPAIRAYGGSMLDEDYRPVFNGPESVNALEVYRDMVTGYGSPPRAPMLYYYEIRELFKQGKIAAIIAGSHLFTELGDAQQSEIWDRWDAAPMPRGPVKRATSPWAWSFAINSRAQNKSAAWLFLQWATSRQTAMLMRDGGAPARQSLWYSDAYDYLNAPGLVAAVRWVLDEGDIDRMQNALPEFPEAGLVVSRAFNEIFYGAPVQETLDQAAERVEQIMHFGVSRGAQ